MSAEDLEDLYDNAPCGYLSFHPDGRIAAANATLAAWTGHPKDQLVGKKFYDLLTVGTRILFETSFAPLLNMHGTFDEIAFDLRTADGGVLPVSAAGNIRKNAQGESVLTRIIFFRAAERRRYERQILDAQQTLADSERAASALLTTERETAMLREQFIAVLGHDLRNPLASISGGLRLLQKEQTADRRKMLLEMVEASIVRMSALIDNVLDFARGRLGTGIPLEFQQDIWLSPLLEHVVSEVRVGASDRTIETDFDLQVPVKCDPSRIAQLVSNLVGNAIAHGKPGEPVRVHADTNGGSLTIWIANGGSPILPEAMEQLFQPFFRGEVRSSQQGLGLGLYIASEIAKAHGGKLTVSSGPEETRFTFQMPIAAR